MKCRWWAGLEVWQKWKMEQKGRSQLLRDLDKALILNRIPQEIWIVLLLPYVPIGLFLVLLRLCMSLQALLILFVFPEGIIKRVILRIYFGVLGLVVTTEGENKQPKLYVSNRLSYIDHIVLHLATDCITVSSSNCIPPLSALFQHHVLKAKDDSSIEDEVKQIPQFDKCDSVVDYTPFAVQPEFMTTNGCHMLLQFSSWPFSLNTPIQPIALNSFRSLPIQLTTAKSSGWSDLFWTLFVPFTYYHVTFLPQLEPGEDSEQFAKRVQQNLASHLKLKCSQASQEDVEKWFSDPPKPPSPPPPPPRIPTGPIIPPSEFDPRELSSYSSLHSSPETEAMVQQVTAVLPQIPHTAIRKDLVKTQSVDITITNFLEGRVKYQPVAAHYPSSNSGGGGVSKRTGGSKTRSTNTASLSAQRQVTFEERKRVILEQARRRYLEKHGQ